jgi:hypothetical protein
MLAGKGIGVAGGARVPPQVYRPGMHAGTEERRRKARTPHVVKFRVEDDGTLAVERIAEERGLTTTRAKAAFFGSTETTWRRLLEGEIEPGRETIAAVLGSHPDDDEITFDALFEVVSP